MRSAPWYPADGGGMQLETQPVSPVPGTYLAEGTQWRGLGANLGPYAFNLCTVSSSFLSSCH